MALDRLLAALERETDERAAAVVRAAEEDAARIRASAAAECRRQRERRLAASEQQLRAESRQAIAAARHGAESRVLAARAEALERVMELARQRLPELLASTASRERVAAAVGDAIDCAGEAAVLVRASPGLVAALGERFAGRRGVRIEADCVSPFRAVKAGGGP